MKDPAAQDGFGPCATEASEPRQVRKEAAIRGRPRAPQANLNSSSAAGIFSVLLVQPRKRDVTMQAPALVLNSLGRRSHS